MGSGKFEHYISEMDSNLGFAKGELYKFAADGKKRSGAKARAAFLCIMKVCKAVRAEIQETKRELPTRKRVITQETKDKMTAARAARKSSKKAPVAVVSAPVAVVSAPVTVSQAKVTVSQAKVKAAGK